MLIVDMPKKSRRSNCRSRKRRRRPRVIWKSRYVTFPSIIEGQADDQLEEMRRDHEREMGALMEERQRSESELTAKIDE